MRRVAASVLGLIHGLVGKLHQLVKVLAIVGEEADSDARAYIELFVFDLYRIAQGRDQLVCHGLSLLRGVQVGDQGDEFVAAHACQGIALAQQRGKPL